ncbi:hypothetical protein CAPTEDRAFT_222520 [Capitella teleta]|uniref:Uncharacterized protein n=1 Tax=Capitella teleta TaxID=283909 RepID=R7UXD5_CAPTE|nr:hypothetical protein CAPTEDRAFT_222520 [Capitella teleta]|eukprot:ELU10962.1 hypothetical protein CAPTEDRAFT_222520 [Capitella teleta]
MGFHVYYMIQSIQNKHQYNPSSALGTYTPLPNIDQKWRDSCVELAWLEQLEKSGQLPEWDYRLPSIILEGVDEGQLASSKRGPCPLCSHQFFSENFPCQLKQHFRSFHRNHNISYAGRKHLICRLPCSQHSHYHCSCGIVILKRRRATCHIRSCCKVEPESREEWREDKEPECTEEMVLECGEDKEPECTEEMVLECGEDKELECTEEMVLECEEEKEPENKQTERSLLMEPVQSGEKALHERQEEKAVQSEEKASHKTEDEENQEEKAVQSKEKASHKREDEKNVQREEKLFFKIAGDFQETEENSDEEGANCTEGYATSEEDFKTLLNSTDSDYIKFNGRNLSVNYTQGKRQAVMWSTAKNQVPQIPVIGRPFVSVMQATYECHHGPSHSKTTNVKNSDREHSYSINSKRRKSSSKKVFCPAKLYVRKVAIFMDPKYQVLNFHRTEKKTRHPARQNLQSGCL